MSIKIEKYNDGQRRSRFWGVYDEGKLVCVTVYKKGAEEVKKRLSN